MKRFIFTIFLAIIIFTFNGCLGKSISHEVKDRIADAKIGEPKIVSSISTQKYAYNTLLDEEKVVYDQALNAVLTHAEDTVISTKDADMLSKVVECIMADYGGLFWMDGYSYKTYESGDYITRITFTPSYTMTRQERDDMQMRIDEIVAEWLNELPPDADDYAKSKYVFEKIVSEVDYVRDSENNQNIISAFINKQTVCQGYACAVSYLLSQIGVESTIITGRADGESHAWNLIKLDGEYYQLDATWGNSTYKDDPDSDIKTINYAYLNSSDDGFMDNRQIDVSFPVPECVATADSYFTREGLFFPYMDGVTIAQRIGEAYRAGKKDISFKFGNNEVYEGMKAYLLDGKHFADYASGLKIIKYLDNPGMYTITFKF